MGSPDSNLQRCPRLRRVTAALIWFGAAAGLALPGIAAESAPSALDSPEANARWGLIERYCLDCHNTTDWAGGVAFDTMSSFEALPADAKVWEAAAGKLRAGFMPPPGARARPDSQTVSGLIGFLEARLDAAQVTPAPGRVLLHQMYAAFHERMVVYLNKGWDPGDAIADRPLKAFEDQFGDPTAFIHARS
jgi:hypothetical protein